MRTGLIAAAALAVAAAGGIWWATAGGTQAGILAYQDAAVVAEGKRIYAAQCASCHGERLQGQANWRERDAEGYLPAPPHDPRGHTWHHPDEQLIALTSKGTAQLVGGGYKSRMPGFDGILTEAQIIAVLSYIKSTWPGHIIDRHNQINAQTGD